MKGLRRLALLAILANGAICAPAWAVLVTIDPDDYAAGTNLSHAVAGVSLSTFSSSGNGSFAFSDVFSSQDAACVSNSVNCKAVTGSKVFSMSSGAAYDSNAAWHDSPASYRCFQRVTTGSCTQDSFRALLISFDNPTNYVDISGVFTSDWPLLIALDSSRNLISFGTEEGAGMFGGTAASRYTSALANISYVVAAGWSASAHLDALRYDDMNHSVPEPGTALLFGLALAGFAAARRKRGARAAA
jgi:hypothetical protein